MARANQNSKALSPDVVARILALAQRLAQFAVLAQTHFGFTKCPALVAHQAENGQQLRLVELVLAETASLGGSTALQT
jgi:hypothetical protein